MSISRRCGAMVGNAAPLSTEALRKLSFSIAGMPIQPTICCSKFGRADMANDRPGGQSMRKTLNMLNTIAGSMLEEFYPAGWNLRKIDDCCAMNMSQLLRRARFWH